MINLKGKTALITGASRGIGRACALRLAEAGCDIAFTYLNSPRNAREVADEVAHFGRQALAIKADVSQPSDIETTVRITGEEFGRLDVLISNAAGGGFRPVLDTTLPNFDYAMHINVRALILLAQYAAPWLEKATDRGKIITMSSMGGSRAIPLYGLIGAAKGAIESLTRHLALELGPRGINVNCICAGMVDTGALSHLPNKEDILRMRRQKSLVGDIDLKPEHVADVALFLASPLANLVQGATLVIDGGTSLHV
ncbi:MAG: SDR family oxidoreductase [Acidobacteria bacterium]|nr:SDR family oxidoreductase [Acidobacteriota bacterium]MBI3656590.1 SDR family oxidoreductase [Acidobacteriota bacterium]